MTYYSSKVKSLQDLFGTTDVQVEPSAITVMGQRFPTIDDVVILTPPESSGERNLGPRANLNEDLSAAVRHSFGIQWRAFPEILPEHAREFERYFDLVDVNRLSSSRVCDLGCGTGRWSYFLVGRCRELVLVDFSDAVFVARNNLRASSNALFFKCDIMKLPFRDDFADVAFCLGVLHHLPMDAIEATRRLARFAPQLLAYVYYAFDNRPAHFRALFGLADTLRRVLASVQNPTLRLGIASIITASIYVPLIQLGRLLGRTAYAKQVPLYEGYRFMSFSRIRQDAYDRFFTPIEHRYTRSQIESLRDTFDEIVIAETLPYWHFLCRR